MRIRPGYDLAGRSGAIGIRLSVFDPPAAEAVLPVAFTDDPDSPRIGLTVFTDAETGEETCSGQSVGGEIILTPETYQVACSAFDARPRREVQGCVLDPEDPDDPETRSWTCRIHVRPVATPEPPKVLIGETAMRHAGAITYLAIRPGIEVLLPPGSGKLDAPLDYAARALRLEMEGPVRVLLRLDGGRKPVGCRPLASSGYAFLDNDTCVQLLRRGRYVYHGGEPGPSGYVEVTIRWVMPE